MIRALIFDCWGTLFSNHSGYLPRIAAEFGTTLDDYEFLKAFETVLMKESFKEDEVEAQLIDLFSRMGKVPDAEKIQNIKSWMLDSRDAQYAYPESIEVLRSLKSSYKLALLSNTSELSFKFLMAHNPLEELFDCILPSYESGLLKPDPEVFALACSTLGVLPEEAVMVGDSLSDDFKAAKACGLGAVLVDRLDRHPDESPRVKDLTELEGVLRK